MGGSGAHTKRGPLQARRSVGFSPQIAQMDTNHDSGICAICAIGGKKTC